MVDELEQLSERYRLEDTVASGGMGTVFRARDEVLGRTVAVKLLKDTLATDDNAVERFKQEARIAASLAHPGIAQVFDFGDEDGRPFIVMEFLEGDDLHQSISRNGPMDPVDAATVAAKVAEALQHAHAAGAVHRDVKPGNIFRTGKGEVKLTDFGIARLTSQSSVTSTGAVVGTHHYISPEIVNGERATGAADIYSLGCVLYEMLTGRPPFEGDTPLTIAMAHVSKPAPDVRSLNPAVPESLAAVAEKAMAKDPGDRFASAGEMAEALRVASADVETAPVDRPTAVIPTEGPAEARDTPPVEQTPIGRRRYTVPAWVLVLMGLGILFLMFLLIFRREPAEPQTFSLASYVGQPFAEAAEAAQSKGLKVSRDTRLSPEPAGEVIEQSLPAGQQVSANQGLTLIVSDGNGVEVPNLVAQSQQGAEIVLTSLGLKPQPEGEVGEDKAIIVSQDPEAEKIVPKGTSISFVLESESEDNKGKGRGNGGD